MKKTTGRVLALVVALCSTAALAATQADQQKLEKLLKKYSAASGTPLNVPSKTLCICRDAGAPHNKAGYLRYAVLTTPRTFTVLCQVPQFDTTGTVTGGLDCDDYHVLAR